ncbi:MAG: type II toxin-antitoxin system PemK/MazF family toxin [Propionibacteriaceae bacterium]|nr:type II toxin-antitoxin system PemK/MazF family toxin [Propionibacteriaceae bacterium]
MIVWASFDPVTGKEQAGRRPALVISSDAYLSLVTDLVIVMPVTSRNRGWDNHVVVAPSDMLGKPSWIMTEQIRALSRQRIHQVVGSVTDECLSRVLLILRYLTEPLSVSPSTQG